jgi:cytoskeletal protein RodZ
VDRLGRKLREAREAKGQTLEEAEAVTHIRAHFLELLEAGDFAAFESGHVQVRGFLRIYARYLGLPPEQVLGQYRAEVYGLESPAGKDVEKEDRPEPIQPPDDLTAIQFRPRDIPVSSSLPRWMSVRTVMIVGLVLTILLGILAIVAYMINQPSADETFGRLNRAMSVAIAQAPTFSTAGDQPTPTSSAIEGRIALTLEATRNVHVRVRRGSQVVFEEMMVPGEEKSWVDDEIVVVETANGAALQVAANGIRLGQLGEQGELCRRAWGPDGEVTPP